MSGNLDEEFTQFVTARLGGLRRVAYARSILGREVGGVLAVFRHLHLFGPDVATLAGAEQP